MLARRVEPPARRHASGAARPERGDPSKEWRYERVLRCREHLIAPGDRVTVLGAVSWEQDPEPSSAGRGYRDAPKRVVLSALPEGSLMASDRSDLVHDA